MHVMGSSSERERRAAEDVNQENQWDVSMHDHAIKRNPEY